MFINLRRLQPAKLSNTAAYRAAEESRYTGCLAEDDWDPDDPNAWNLDCLDPAGRLPLTELNVASIRLRVWCGDYLRREAEQ